MAERKRFWQKVASWLVPEAKTETTYRIPTKGIGFLDLPPTDRKYTIIDRELREKYRREREQEAARQRAEETRRKEAKRIAEEEKLAEERRVIRERDETLRQVEKNGLLDVFSYAARTVAEGIDASEYVIVKENTDNGLKPDTYVFSINCTLAKSAPRETRSYDGMVRADVRLDATVNGINNHSWQEINQDNLQEIIIEAFSHLSWETTPSPGPDRSFQARIS